MGVAKSGGNQDLDFLPVQFRGAVSENTVQQLIARHDRAMGVDQKLAIGRLIKSDFLQGDFDVAPFGNIGNRIKSWVRGPVDTGREATSTQRSSPSGRMSRISRVAPAPRTPPPTSCQALGSAARAATILRSAGRPGHPGQPENARQFRIDIADDAIAIRQDEAYRHFFDHRRSNPSSSSSFASGSIAARRSP